MKPNVRLAKYGLFILSSLGLALVADSAVAQKGDSPSGLSSKVQPKFTGESETVRKGLGSEPGVPDEPEKDELPAPLDEEPGDGEKPGHEDVRKSAPESGETYPEDVPDEQDNDGTEMAPPADSGGLKSDPGGGKDTPGKPGSGNDWPRGEGEPGIDPYAEPAPDSENAPDLEETSPPDLKLDDKSSTTIKA